MKELGEARRILGAKTIRNRHMRKIFLSPTEYVTKALRKFATGDSKPTHILYDVVVGSVMYLMLCTRPDFTFSNSLLSKYMVSLGLKHWRITKYLLSYVLGTKNLGLVYKKKLL